MLRCNFGLVCYFLGCYAKIRNREESDIWAQKWYRAIYAALTTSTHHEIFPRIESLADLECAAASHAIIHTGFTPLVLYAVRVLCARILIIHCDFRVFGRSGLFYATSTTQSELSCVVRRSNGRTVERSWSCQLQTLTRTVWYKIYSLRTCLLRSSIGRAESVLAHNSPAVERFYE